MESKCHKFLFRQKFTSFLKYIYIYIYIYIHYTDYIYLYKIFFTTLDKGLRQNINKKRDGEIGKHTQLNESTEYEKEKVKQAK